MTTIRLVRLSVVLLALALTSCESQTDLTGPAETVEPSFGKSGGTQDSDARRIEALLVALYPGPGLENAALNRWANIQRQMSRGQVDAARSQMRALAAQATGFAADGRLDDPVDPLLPGTVRGAVTELVTRLFVFVGLEVADALQEYPDDLPEDFGFGVIDPDDGGTVVTTNNWAAVIAGAGATGEEAYVTIELLDEEACAVAAPLTQAMGCWDINRYPEGSFTEDVQVEICVADNPDMSDEEWNLVLVHHKSDDGVVTPLPWAEPTTIDCTGYGTDGPMQTADAGPVRSFFTSVGSRVAGLLLPTPLGASMRFMLDRPPRGIGGTTGSFSEFFGAVPESAKPNLVNWWSADGHFLDMYGFSNGEPNGNVAFEPGISADAFTFTLDGGFVHASPLPDAIANAQELTVATWVKLDPSGPADAIQRFVTLEPEKAVLRQEGGSGRNRMLHFYMRFTPDIGGDMDLRAIRVDNAFQTGCYHFFVGTYGEDDYMRAYLDGVEVGAEYVPGGVVAPATSVLLAADNEPLDGALDEVMIFDRALTPGEIQEIYDAGGSNKCVAPPDGVSVSGTVHYSDKTLDGVRVELASNADPGHPRLTVTAGGGHYEFLGVAPGDYMVSVYGEDYPDPESPGDFPFISWVGRPLHVVGADIVQDRDLPKVITLLTPTHESMVLPSGLTLTWEPNVEAEAGGAYSLQINDADDGFALVESAQPTTSSYEVQTALTLGNAYSWQVDASDEDGHWVGTTQYPFRFHVTSGPIMDGVLSPGEWDQATRYDFDVSLPEGGTSPGSIFIQVSGDSIYLAVRFERGTLDSGNTAAFEFDNDNDGIREDGDDIFLVNGFESFADDFYQADTGHKPGDTGWGGTNDGNGTLVNDGTYTIYEMSHPLDSADDAHDFSLSSEDEVGLRLFLRVANWPDWADTDYPAAYDSFITVIIP